MTYARLVVAGALALATTISAAQRPEAPYAFRYHSYAESTALLQGLAARYPRLARLSSLGRGAAGDRELWVLEVGNQDTGPAAEKPAVYFDGNQHATEVMGGEVTLHLAHYLLSRYTTDAEITRLIDTRVIYIVQRANPDGAEAYMTGRVDWDPARAPGQRDADGDGRKGEDGPEDVDGDGQILQMRVPDPGGDWTPYGRDARVLVRRRPADTAGPFYRVLEEGLDNDGDGRLNEDPPHTQFISNRNYPAFWASDDGRFRGEGDYPLQEPNSRRLVEFILGRPHISMVESFHTTSGVHLRPYAARPDTGFPVQDLHDYQAVLAKGAAITGYPAASVYNDFTDIQPGLPPDEQPGVRHGVFIDWAYVHAGLFAATTELWTMEPFLNEAGWDEIPRDKPLFAVPGRYNRPDVQAAVLRWLDARHGHPDLGGEGFVNWRAFAHPTLGRVELGGFTRYFPRNPPPGPYFERVAVDQARFAVARALLTPQVRVRDVQVAPAEGGAWIVTATVVNQGYLDTSTEQARLAQLAVPVTASIELAGGAGTPAPRAVQFPFLRGNRGGPHESLYRAEWRVTAPPGTKATVVLRSEKGGVDRRPVVLAATGRQPQADRSPPRPEVR